MTNAIATNAVRSYDAQIAYHNAVHARHGMLLSLDEQTLWGFLSEAVDGVTRVDGQLYVHGVPAYNVRRLDVVSTLVDDYAARLEDLDDAALIAALAEPDVLSDADVLYA